MDIIKNQSNLIDLTMNEEYDLKVEDTNEEALASKMYNKVYLVLRSRRATSKTHMPRNLRTIEANEISSSIGGTGPECT